VSKLSRPAEILDFTRAVWEINDLWVARQEREIVSRSGRNGEAVPQRDRGAGLQVRNLDHPSRTRKISREPRRSPSEHDPAAP
jgi:hypothetical protein